MPTTSRPRAEPEPRSAGGLPPGPECSPLLQAVLYQRDPLGVLVRARARHGPVFTLWMALKGPLVVVAAADEVEALLRSDPASTRAGAARLRILPLASARSPFGADGERHHAIRAAMEPSFATVAQDRIEAIADEHAAGWPRLTPFRSLSHIRSLATDIFVRLVLRIDDARRRDALVIAIRRMLWTLGNPPSPVPAPDDGLLGAAVDRIARRRMDGVARLLEQEIGERRTAGRTGDDLLGRVLEIHSTARDAIDALLVVIAAAQEPPAIALANVVYELARRPRWQERFLDAPEDRDAIVAEVLRLRPAAQAALRELTAPATIAGHRLAAGTLVALPSPLLHRDPRAFPTPDAFQPERFARGTPPGAPYFPFGGGARRCIGEPLARAELAATIPAILTRLRLRAVWPRPERMVVRGTVLVPHRSAVLQARPR
jgi:cytochrome P450